jgi:hypothetical protein
MQVSPKQLTVNIKQQTGMAGLQDLLQRNSSVVNAIHVTAALQWLVTHPREQPQSTEQLAVVVQQWMGWVEVGQLTACSCAHLAYYCSKLGYVEDLGLYRALLQRCLVVKEDAAPQAVSNLLYAFGSQEQLHGLLEQDVLVELLQQLQQMAALNAQDVANALWAAAKAAPQDSPALKVVVAQLLGTFVGSASDATPQNVSNTLYALALLPRAWPMDSALQLVEQLLQLLQRTHGAQSAANVLWAMGQYAERGWLSDLSDQSLAQVMAAATQLLGKVNGGPLQGSRSSAAKPQELANACWGVVKLQQLRVAPSSQRQPWQAPLERAVDAIVALLPQANSQDLSNTLWACGAVRYYPQQLLRAIASTPAPMPQVQQATPQEVGNMAWALAVLAPDPLPEALMASLLQRMQDLLTQQPAAVDAQNLSITAWAVAVMNQQQLAGQLAPLTAAAFSQQHWPGSHEEAKKQWHQVHLWLTDTQVVGAAGLGAFPGVSQQELEQCAAAWEEQLARDTTVSDVQKEVAKVSCQSGHYRSTYTHGTWLARCTLLRYHRYYSPSSWCCILLCDHICVEGHPYIAYSPADALAHLACLHPVPNKQRLSTGWVLLHACRCCPGYQAWRWWAQSSGTSRTAAAELTLWRATRASCWQWRWMGHSTSPGRGSAPQGTLWHATGRWSGAATGWWLCLLTRGGCSSGACSSGSSTCNSYWMGSNPPVVRNPPPPLPAAAATPRQPPLSWAQSVSEQWQVPRGC